MRSSFLLVLGLWGLWGCLGAVAQPQPQPMLLHFMEQPPLSSLGPQGQPVGRLVERMQRVAAQGGLPLRWQLTPLKRSLQELQDNQEPLCVLGVFRAAERERFARFSRVFSVGRPQLLVARPAAAPLLRGMPSARAALRAPQLRFLVFDGVSYGDEVDAWIRERQGPIVRAVTGGARLSAMLSNDRADFAITTADGLEAMGAEAAAELVLIQELQLPPPPARYVACSMKVPLDWMRALDQAILALDAPRRR